MSMAVIKARPVRSDTPYILQGDGKPTSWPGTRSRRRWRRPRRPPTPAVPSARVRAARILGISRKTVQRMLDADAIPTGTTARAAVDDLRGQSEDMGLYDMPDARQKGRGQWDLPSSTPSSSLLYRC